MAIGPGATWQCSDVTQLQMKWAGVVWGAMEETPRGRRVAAGEDLWGSQSSKVGWSHLPFSVDTENLNTPLPCLVLASWQSLACRTPGGFASGCVFKEWSIFFHCRLNIAKCLLSFLDLSVANLAEALPASVKRLNEWMHKIFSTGFSLRASWSSLRGSDFYSSWCSNLPSSGVVIEKMWLLWGTAGRFYLNTEAGQAEK